MKFEFLIKGLDCANCAAELERALQSCKEFESARVNFAASKIKVTSALSYSEVYELVKSITARNEPDARVFKEDGSGTKKTAEKRSTAVIINFLLFVLGLLLAGVVLFVPLNAEHNLIEMGHASSHGEISDLQLALSIIAAVILCGATFLRAVKIFIRSFRVDENFLICLSVFGALAIGEIMEGLMVIILYQIGKLLERLAVAKSRKSVTSLTSLKAPYANILRDGVFVRTDVNEVEAGNILEARPGEIVAVDGTVQAGKSNLNQASLTGESAPVFVQTGDNVMSGSSVLDGVLEIKAGADYENSTAAKILELLETASDKKARAETLVSRAAKYYTPIVLGLALGTLLLLPIFGLTFKDSFYRALTFLVVACPCAIAISVPLTYFAGIGYAGSRGILVKGSNYLDNFVNVKHLVVDKTGTLTTGKFTVKNIDVLDKKLKENEILKIMASGEAKSNHPLAVAVCKAYSGELYKISDYKELSGKGISFKIGTSEYYAGKPQKIDESNLTSIVLIKNKKTVASVYLEDEIKQGANEFIKFFTKKGVKVHMLTGDSEVSAKRVAHEVGIEGKDVHFGLLPADKYKYIEKLIAARKKNEVIAFAGDGINDTPVIMLSDIGIVMGGIGAQSSVEAGDIVIMDDRLSKIPETYALSHRTRSIIVQNLLFAIGTKVLVLGLITAGLAGMLGAVIADVGVTLMTIFNSLRQLLRIRK